MKQENLVIEILTPLAVKLFELKCPNCNRVFEVNSRTIMYFCPCGYMNEIKFEVVD